MIDITDSASLAAALNSPLDDALIRLLTRRRDQLLSDTDGRYDIAELVHIIVAEPGDSIATIETTAGYPIIRSPIFEWVALHGAWFEGIAVLSDDGFGIAMFVPDDDRIDPELLSLMREQAEPANLPQS